MSRSRTYGAVGGDEAYQAGQLVAVWQDGYGLSISRDFGDTWTKTDTPNDLIKGVKISPSGQYVALVGYNIGLRLSEDYGRTFRTISDISGYDNLAMSDDAKYIVAIPSRALIGQTTIRLYANGVVSERGFGAPIYDADISADGQYICVSAKNGLYVSSDYGNTYNRLPLSGGKHAEHLVIDASVSPRRIIAFSGGNGQGYVNPQQDFTRLGWRVVYMDTRCVDIAMSDDGRVVLAVRPSSSVVRSTNGGISWEETRGLPAGDYSSSVALSRDGSVQVYSVRHNLYISRNSGVSHSIKILPTANPIKAIAINSNNYE